MYYVGRAAVVNSWEVVGSKQSKFTEVTPRINLIPKKLNSDRGLISGVY